MICAVISLLILDKLLLMFVRLEVHKWLQK